MKQSARMNPSASLRTDQEKVYTLWEELEQYPANRSDEALAHLVRGLRDLLAADDVKWIASVRVLRGQAAGRDALSGWRLRARYDLVPDPPHYRQLVACLYRRDNKMDPGFEIGHATLAMIQGMGLERFQSHRMRDGWIPFKEFRQSEHYRLNYTALNITDRMWLSIPLNADAESIFLVDRHGSAPRFLVRDLNLASMILRGLRPLQRRMFLDHGLLIASDPLSPTSRRIIQRLLTGESEKEIACAMNQSPTTTHKYISTIYERFGVKGRAGLMSLWLGNATPAATLLQSVKNEA